MIQSSIISESTPPFLPFYLYFPSGGASYGTIELIAGLVIQSQQLAVGFRPATRRRSLRGHCGVAECRAVRPYSL
ncbi:hypothetical protein KY290_000740 [Solanum tuberosum]|uniref:Uncharacterized protein n=1 Tax=Solanum tuberosum TaxID=4113 RepID=A0ABQ7WME7_SOLTU|nr:hypothetical protein KY289_000801 [Solanum tuberosum]KAH0781142.1 hypothetical protein KY290_000740 [Solanum tuberosum]